MSVPFSPRSCSWLLAGIVLAVGSTVGWVFRDTLDSARPSSPPAGPPAEPLEPVVVCVGHVDLEHGTTALNPAQPGTVVEIVVHESQEVAKGTALLRLDDRAARLRVAEAGAGLRAAQKQLTQARQAPEQLCLEVSRQQAAIDAAAVRLSAARSLLAYKQQLLKKGLIENHEVTVAQDQVKEAEILSGAEQVKLRELQLQDPRLSVDRAEADVAACQARVELAQYALDQCTLKAPGAGTVLRILVNPGEVVSGQPQQPALLFAPHGRRVIRAEVEQEFIDRLAVGLPARARDPRNIGPVWRGEVLRVSDWLLRRRSVLQEPGQFLDVRTVECLISIEDGQPLPRLGERLTITLYKPKQ